MSEQQQLTVLCFAFRNEAASLQAFHAVMKQIAGGSAYRVLVGGKSPVLVVFALANADDIRTACRIAGGTPTTVAPELIRDLAERSARAAQRGITGKRHYEPGTPADANLPNDPSDYEPKE